MLNLTEETFDATVESVGAGPVTQGAQRKILLSVNKLRERYGNLCHLEQVSSSEFEFNSICTNSTLS